MSSSSELRGQAADADQRAAESWERSDTDGFLTQWAVGLTAQQLRRQAEIEDAGGTAVFTALFDTEGNLVPAKWVETRFGFAWGILPSDDPRGRFTGWFSPSQARDPARRKAADAAKGYQVGKVRVPARAIIDGQGHGLSGSAWVAVIRADGGFSRDVEIVTAANYGSED